MLAMKLCECGCEKPVSAPTHRFVRGHHWKAVRDRQNIPDAKTCEQCGTVYGRPQHANTNHWLNRRFCSEECRRVASGRDPEATERWCSSCQRVLPREAFYKDATTSDGLTQYCKDCRRRRRKPRPKTAARQANLNAFYGITPEHYAELLQSQNGVCAICREPEAALNYRTGQPLRLSVDHCHSTLRVRGLLCTRCNQGIGHMKDDPGRLRAAADYLERQT